MEVSNFSTIDRIMVGHPLILLTLSILFIDYKLQIKKCIDGYVILLIQSMYFTLHTPSHNHKINFLFLMHHTSCHSFGSFMRGLQFGDTIYPLNIN